MILTITVFLLVLWGITAEIRFHLLKWDVQDLEADDTVQNECILDLQSHPIYTAEVTVKTGKLTRGTSKAACWDIISDQTGVVYPGGQMNVATGLVTEMVYCDGFMFDRSGLSAKFEVSRRAGVIDEDYKLEWSVILRNEGKEPYQVKEGDRVAQVYFLPKFNVPVHGGVSLDTIRDGGLGSTGK